MIDGDVRGVLRALEGEGQGLAPVLGRITALLGIEIAHLRDVGELHRAAAADRDLRLTELKGVPRIAEHAHRLLGAGDLGAAARRIEVHRPELGIHLAGGDAERLQPCRIEDHPYLA